MIENFLFTIAIPAYKGLYLKECISSILNQSYPFFELIIINDFSPDSIEDVVNGFNDRRILYFENTENIGPKNLVHNWNKGLEKAKGDYFILMGDDDKMEPEYLEEFGNLIVRYPDLNVYHCRSKIINQDSTPIMLTPSWPEFESVYDNISHRMFFNRVQFISDFVYKTDNLLKNGGFYFLPLAWGSDNITSYIAIGNKGIAHINKPLLNYRKHPLTLSSSGAVELKMEALNLQSAWFYLFLKNKPDTNSDLILYNNICQNLKKQQQKDKIYVMASSYQQNFILNILRWTIKLKKYKISIPEIFGSILLHLKTKVNSRKNYNTSSFE